MSLQQAKRLAEIREEIEAASEKVSARYASFRKKINEEVIRDFTAHLEGNGFEVTKSAYGVNAAYKDLKVNLVLAKPEDAYVGIFHSFDITVNGKKHDVYVVAVITGIPDRPVVRTGDSVQLLEQDRDQLIASLDSQLHSYKFDCAQRGGNHRRQAIIKDTIAEVIDVFLA